MTDTDDEGWRLLRRRSNMIGTRFEYEHSILNAFARIELV